MVSSNGRRLVCMSGMVLSMKFHLLMTPCVKAEYAACGWLCAIWLRDKRWPCPVLSAKEMRSMKVASACVRALLRRKRCVRRRLAKGVLFVATRVCPRRVAIAGHVIKLN